jgi:hypothetical protein
MVNQQAIRRYGSPAKSGVEGLQRAGRPHRDVPARTGIVAGGTEGSNLASSSGDSGTNSSQALSETRRFPELRSRGGGRLAPSFANGGSNAGRSRGPDNKARRGRGTEGSNPSPSSGQSVSLPQPLSSVENPGFPRGCARLAWGLGSQRRAGLSIARQPAGISLSGHIPVPQCRQWGRR